MIVSGFYCPNCGHKQGQCAPIEIGEEIVISFFCENCDKSIAFSI